MSTLRPDSRALFKAARRTLSPTREDEARIGKALGLGVAVGVATTTTTTAAATTAVTAVPAATAATVAGTTAAVGAGSVAAAKWIVVLVVALGVGATGVAVRRSTGPNLAVAATANTIVAVAVPPPGMTPAPINVAPPPAAPASASVEASPGLAASTGGPVSPPLSRPAVDVPVGPVPVPVPQQLPAVSVAEEARLLREAVAALRMGDVDRASTLLDEHAHTFPSGVLVEERDAERVRVLCARRDLAGADAARARFLQEHPDSPLATRVRSACGAP
jgi:hypothetical protein